MARPAWNITTPQSGQRDDGDDDVGLHKVEPEQQAQEFFYPGAEHAGLENTPVRVAVENALLGLHGSLEIIAEKECDVAPLREREGKTHSPHGKVAYYLCAREPAFAFL